MGESRYFCPLCGVRYTKYKYLKSHLKECGIKFNCDLCNQSFKQKRSYALHNKRKHGIRTAKLLKEDYI